jgi:hypothetical protein
VRIFLAGATGVTGVRLIPLLLPDGHTVAQPRRKIWRPGVETAGTAPTQG